MSMFASKTPRDLNHDPKPYVTYANERRTDVRSAGWDIQSDGGTEYVRVFDPRPEFDHVQHNEPNPILVAFREIGDPENPGPWIDATWSFSLFGGYREWDDVGSYFHAFTKATEAQNRHAREVLKRLPALEAATEAAQ